MPTLPESLNLAEQALRAGDRARAAMIYEAILKVVPEEAHALNGLGVIAYRWGTLEDAEAYHRRAIARFAGNPAFHNNLGLVYARQNRVAEAIACAREAVRLAPESAPLHNNLGNALKQDRQFEAALASYQEALRLQADYALARYNLANVLVELRRHDEAEREFRRTIDQVPDDVEAHTNLGSLLQIQGRFAEAMESFDTALRLRPESPEVRRNRAMLWLLLGKFEEAWKDYEARWLMVGAELPKFRQPCWDGQSLDGRTILLWGEQGLGDIVQMVRFAPLLARQGARVIVDCRQVLHPLLAATPGIDRLLEGASTNEPFDYYVPMMSLPTVLRTTVATIPANVPYVFAEPARIDQWRAKLSGVPELKVGIAWQGNPEFVRDQYRSIPLSEFAPLARCPGVKLFSLQKGFGREQLDALAAEFGIVDLGSSLDEGTGAFVETAAVMKNLDLVITSDTAMAHVAGALGVPVWVALSYVPNSRWLLEREDCPWYPTMRLFRQERFCDWQGAFARIAEALATLSHGRSAG